VHRYLLWRNMMGSFATYFSEIGGESANAGGSAHTNLLWIIPPEFPFPLAA
jgi:hypothetical protein